MRGTRIRSPRTANRAYMSTLLRVRWRSPLLGEVRSRYRLSGNVGLRRHEGNGPFGLSSSASGPAYTCVHGRGAESVVVQLATHERVPAGLELVRPLLGGEQFVDPLDSDHHVAAARRRLGDRLVPHCCACRRERLLVGAYAALQDGAPAVEAAVAVRDPNLAVPEARQ